ncbi:hypothetical protein EB796_005278 [Bugula neritina]|uniref:RWD domain-containing protein n=1 Tax=Bugula neritina TaxID=10212 RepID=A0A7J7KDZ6_BUGNE|nr:hypothetical protein EB796_005278 [Bugula neritina]
MADSSFLLAELKDLKTRCEKVVAGSTLVACVPQVVQVKISRTEFKELTAHFQFPADYPSSPLTIELKSKPLDFKLLQGLEKVCTDEVKKYVTKQQVMPMLLFIRKFIDDNPLCVCRGEVAHIQKNLLEPGDALKLKQKTSQISLTICGGQYFIKMLFTVPDLYPLEKLGVECVDHNFPELFKQNFFGQCVEIARRCVEPPLRKNPKAPPFQPKPSLQEIADFLFTNCVKRYHRSRARTARTRLCRLTPRLVFC